MYDLIHRHHLLPGWHNTKSLSLATSHKDSYDFGSSFHITLPPNLVTPLSFAKSMNPSYEHHSTWLDSYSEEYNNINKLQTYEVIMECEYQELKRKYNLYAIPSMCVQVIKQDSSGRLIRTKSRIVVLGNLDPHQFSKGDCYTPVIPFPLVSLLTSLSVSRNLILQHADCTNAFCYRILPNNELIIVKPPANFPLSQPNTYWKLHTSIYGLRRSPCHWYDRLKHALTNIGLIPLKNEPCFFFGKIDPNLPPIYVLTFVDDVLFFSELDLTEHLFCERISSTIDINFLGDADFYTGFCFDW